MAEKSTGQIVLTIVGAVVGYFTGGASYIALGATVGGAVGAALDPPKGPHLVGPRLSDLSTQTATYGASIPRIYGNIAVAGNVFWIENNALKEVAVNESAGGKGGGGGSETTTYAYYATFAVGLCKGPIVGVRRIWVGSKLFYDAGSIDQSAIRASNVASDLFTLHLGDEAQLPDDRMQATLGVANTPAYRGLAYLVFKDLPLKDHGNTLLGAPVKVEVVTAGAILTYTSTQSTLPTSNYMRAVAWNGSIFCAVGDSSTVYTSRDGVAWAQHPFPPGYSLSDIIWTGKFFVTVASGTNVSAVSKDGKSWVFGTLPYSTAWSRLAYNGKTICCISANNLPFVATSGDGIVWDSQSLSGSRYGSAIGVMGTRFVITSSTSLYSYSNDGITWINANFHTGGTNGWSAVASDGNIFCALLYGTTTGAVSPDGISWTVVTLPTTGNWMRIVFANGVFFAVESGSGKIIYSPDGTNWTSKTFSSNEMTESLAWNGAVFCSMSIQNRNKSNNFLPSSLNLSMPTLASILQAELLSSRLIDSGDIDVTGLTQSVRGYRVASIGAIRSAIEPLQAAYPFDVLQAGYKIKFKPRGSTAVATVEAIDLDARAFAEKPGVSIVNSREMDSILPRRVSLKYLDFDREYDIGEQYAERLNTDAINVSALDMPLVMTASEAAGTVETLLYLYWLERYDVSFSLPPKYSNLEPADVISVNATEGSYSLRLSAISYLSDGRLECSAKYNSPAIYTKTALGEVGTSTGATLSVAGDTRFVLLDIPLLLDATDAPGFPAALCGYLSGWPGGILSRTDDAGQTWTVLQGFSAPGAVIGIASNAIGAGRFYLIDKASALTINIPSGSLSSVTEAQMLNGYNHFAYGAAGRWEIIAAQNCALQADGSYILRDLLRGRFGTEWAAGLHVVGDDVVLLDPAKITFINSNLNAIGVDRTYRAVTAGTGASNATTEDFTYSGVNLECLSPVYLNGNRHPSTNDWSLDWIRRTRVGGEWRDYVDATLGETAQSYEVEIYSSAAYTTLKRTLSGLTTPAAAYTSAQQVTDFGSNQATLYVKVYQLSANVGRGYPLTTSITR